MSEWKYLKRLTSVEFWDLALARAMRSLLQGIAVGFTGGVFNVMEMNWETLLLTGGGMAIYSLVCSMIAGLPEESVYE